MLQKAILLQVDVLMLEKLLVRYDVDDGFVGKADLILADELVQLVDVLVDEWVLAGGGKVEEVILADEAVGVLVKHEEAEVVDLV